MNVLLPRLSGLTALLFAGLALAAVPATTNFQGYVTDLAGSPLNGVTPMTFSVYDAEVAGDSLWTDTLLVNVSQGLFSVQLGTGANPLPAGLFDVPAFVGVEVATDGEMTPRRPLATAPYAFRAQDAETLDGLAAVDYLNVFGGQLLQGSLDVIGSVNAFGGVDLDGQGNIVNLVDMVFASNGSGIEFADGSSQSTNAVNSILAADGDGSQLDADLLDGQHASEIIAAAGDEVRAGITNADLPLVITAPGSYFFAEVLTYADAATAAITIQADRVSIDMMGFSLTGPGSGTGQDSFGIFWDAPSGITISNGSIEEFGGGAITNAGFSSVDNRIADVQASNNGYWGIVLTSSALISRCVASFNGEIGIAAGAGSQILDSTARFNQIGIAALGPSRVSGNVASDNDLVGIDGGDGSRVENNLVENNNTTDGVIGGGILLGGSGGGRIVGNNLSGNLAHGIFVIGPDNVIAQNNVDGSTGMGVSVTQGNLVDGNFIADTDGVALNFSQIGSEYGYRNNTIVGATAAIGGPGTPVDMGGNVTLTGSP